MWGPAIRWRARWFAALALVVIFLSILSRTFATTVSGVPPYDLTDATFDEFLADFLDGDGWVVMEYWAHWCPHCKKFKGSYDVIGSFFNTEPRPEPKVTVARIDCADWPQVCRGFDIKWYPTLRIGRARDFSARNIDAFQDLKHSYSRDVETSITNDIAAITGGSIYTEDEVKRYVVPDAAPGDMPVGKGAQQTMVDLRDTALATVIQFRQMQETPALMKGKEARESLVGMLPFLEAYHPIDKCRESFGELGGLMERFWPEEEEEPAEWELFEGWEACGGEVKWEEWGSCRGSSPDQRGFSCGFWQMLHGLVLGVPDEEAQAFVQAVGEFMLHHFGCHECGEHFRRAAFSPKSGAAVASRRDLVLWMWRVHNIVNNFTAPWSDPAFPKVQWPPPSLCWQCSRDGGRPGPDGKVVWNEEQVYLFLVDFYGFIVDKDRVRHISGADGRAALCEAAQMLWCPEDEGALPRSAMSDDVHFAECAPSIMDLSRCEPCVAGVPTHSGLSDVLGIAQAEKDSEALCGAPNDDDDYYGGGICSLEL